jgi:heavy metal sensor kinase
MPKSLRARLLVWYSAVLIVVLSTFAALAAWAIWRASVEELDAGLRATAVQLGGAVESDGAGRYEINLAEAAFAAFGTAADGPYYAIWSADGTLIDRSDANVDAPFPGEPGTRVRDGRREIAVAGNGNAMVMVGQSLEQAQSSVWAVVRALAVAGGAALMLAFAGGWLLVGRALSPVGRIARIAEGITESNLGQRIDVTTEDELGRVAAALNRAFDRLQEAFERQARFTADASHELRTPLAAQIAELEWALGRRRSEAEYEESLRVCMRAAQRMRAVVEGLLTLARADAGAVPARREPVDLASLARDVVESTRGAAAARRMDLRAEGTAALVSGDADRLRELISNLVSNAVQYGAPGDHVVCRTSASGLRAVLEVEDTGPGIDPVDLPHLFERFYRANKARSRAAGGAGLGLAIAKWVAESHGGAIRCESAVGQGTRMIVELPASAAAGHGADAAADVAHAG